MFKGLWIKIFLSVLFIIEEKSVNKQMPNNRVIYTIIDIMLGREQWWSTYLET